MAFRAHQQLRDDMFDYRYKAAPAAPEPENVVNFGSPARKRDGATALDLVHQHSSGVASRSLHMQGMAIDIRLEGTALSNLRGAALALKAGGVGYYPSSDFVHVDVGRVRRW